MPQPPTAPRTRPAADGGAADAEQTDEQQQQKALDLTVTKVAAGAAAAATSAVVGSYLGAAGTVIGAAIGSVALTVSSALYQRSLDRTRETIVARIRLTPGRRADLSDAPTVRLEVPQPRVSPEEGTTRLRVEPALRTRPRRIWVWAGATVLVFVLGLLVVTGLEWAKGSSLTTGQTGTSVGRVVAPAPAPDAPEDDAGSADEGATTSDSEDEDGATTDATPTEQPRSDEDSTGEATSSAEPTEGAASSDEPESGAEPSAPADADERGRSGADPVPAPEIPVPAAPENG